MANEIREPSAILLLEKLEDASYSEYILFGQQNAGHIGVSIDKRDGSESDIKNLTGKHPAVVGIDTLSFLGYEGTMSELVKVVKQLHKEGVIITLSSHMSNFSLGGDEYYDYSPNELEGNVGVRILPGGDLNKKFLRFLDMIAEFASLCIDLDGVRIPMIFRPFHEDTGTWFWWGKGNLSDDDYITLFRYTIDYLRDTKGVKNFLYAYSPNGQFKKTSEIDARYPGDDYVDVIGMDVYHDLPVTTDHFFKDLVKSLSVVNEFAMDHGKIPALTEIGFRTLDGLSDGYFEGFAPSGNKYVNWFTELLDCVCSSEDGQRLAYMLTWSNFSDTQFWVPYETKNFRHEMCDDFMAFCNDRRIKLAP